MSAIRFLCFFFVLAVATSTPEKAVAQQDLINQLRAWAHDSDSGIAGALIRNFVRQPDPAIITPGGTNAPALSQSVLEGLRANAAVLCARTGTVVSKQECEKELIVTTTAVRELRQNAVQFCAASGTMMSAKECAEFPQSQKKSLCAASSTQITQRECLRYERKELLTYRDCQQLITDMQFSGKVMPEVKRQDFRTRCGQHSDLSGQENWFPPAASTFAPAPAPVARPQVNCSAIMSALKNIGPGYGSVERAQQLGNLYNTHCLR